MIRMLPATQEAVERFHGGPVKRSLRAIVFERAGEIVGCAGIYLQGAGAVIFADLSDEVRRRPRLIVQGYRHLLAIALRQPIPLYAMCDTSIEASERFLRHLGFKPIEGEEGWFQWQA